MPRVPRPPLVADTRLPPPLLACSQSTRFKAFTLAILQFRELLKAVVMAPITVPLGLHSRWQALFASQRWVPRLWLLRKVLEGSGPVWQQLRCMHVRAAGLPAYCRMRHVWLGVAGHRLCCCCRHALPLLHHRCSGSSCYASCSAARCHVSSLAATHPSTHPPRGRYENFLMAEGERVWYWRNRQENERWFWETMFFDRIVARG
jgi:hypothetical protein